MLQSARLSIGLSNTTQETLLYILTESPTTKVKLNGFFKITSFFVSLNFQFYQNHFVS